MLVVILVAVATLLVLYLHLVHRYWTRRGVMQEPPLPVIGNILSVLRGKQHVGHVFSQIYRKYCTNHDAVGVYEFLTPKLLITNPELVKKVLISEFSSFHDNAFQVNEKLDPYFYHDPFCLRGDAWKASRSSMASLMTSSRVKEMFPYMKQQIPQLDDYLHTNKGKEIEVKELSSLFMMDNVSNAMFGLQTNAFTNPEADFRKMGELLIEDLINNRFKNFITSYFPNLRDLFGYSTIPPKVNHYLENMMTKIVEHRKVNNIKRNDVIQNIMNKTGDSVFDMVVLGLAMFVDGFETSATSVSFVLYELAINSQVQQMLFEEVKTVMENSNSVEYEDIIGLKFMDKVIKEAMRKYPVLFYQQKLCTKKCTLNVDGKPVEIEPGTHVVIPTYALHTDPKYWPNPDEFDPERFAEENSIHSCTYIPFGEGPRICPGMRFAGAQMRLLVAHIVYNYKILPTENTPTKITLSRSSILVASEGPIMVKFERRNYI